MKFSAGIAALALTSVLAGCGMAEVKDPYYAMSASQASKLLSQANLPMVVFGDRAFNAKRWRVGSATTMWALMAGNNAEILRLSATAIAEGEGTRVHCDVLPPESPVHDLVAQGLKENEASRDLYAAALAEQVDATLTGRDFNIMRISAATARVTLNALPQIREAMENESKQYQKKEQDVVDKAYANEK